MCPWAPIPHYLLYIQTAQDNTSTSLVRRPDRCSPWPTLTLHIPPQYEEKHTCCRGIRPAGTRFAHPLSSAFCARTPKLTQLSASHVSAQVASVCPTTDVCYKLNIPESTASSGNGDIFFQISAPSNYEWVSLGQGNRMSGANIFVVYTSNGGSNVTLSPRSASGYSQPSFNSDAQVTLLEGSGVSNGKMIANVKCKYSCWLRAHWMVAEREIRFQLQ